MRQSYQEELLDRHLRTFLGNLEPEAMALLRERLQWVEIGAGETLMSQGERGDSMYLVVSGRLRAYVRDDDGIEHMVREMARGQVIGEMSLYTDEPRSATVVAIRDSVLVRLDRAEFGPLLASSAQLSITLTRQLIQRLQSTQSRSRLARPVTLALLPITAGIDLRGFADRLAVHLAGYGRVRVVDERSMLAELREAGLLGEAPHDVAEVNRLTALRLDQIEAQHEYVLLLGNGAPDAWTDRCSHRCDEILLLADADQPPELHETERRCLMARSSRHEAAETLVLLHPEDRRCPRGTRRWLERRPVATHVHLRPALERDLARLARILTHNAVGLVLAGGGARGFAHLGICRELAARGIEVDYVGGTSIGAVMGLLVACDRPHEEVHALAKRAFSDNPTGDFNVLPMLSLIKGRRMRRLLETAVRELLGFDADVEDLWKNYYCVASNYSQASEHRIRRGNLAKAVRASLSIPGALPPVIHDGDLLCDGGTFNNFPVDAMLDEPGVGSVIGVDLEFRKPRRIEHAEPPGVWTLLRDRLRPRPKRRYKFPSLMAYLMNVTILYSSSRQRAARKLTDLYFNPPLERVGMLQWDRFDTIVAQGHAHAVQVLDALAPEQLERFRARAA
ncbi:patatin-like phospholipase family protein [Caldimonas sp. KR1-144]|uniref:patatin-like phospholipase family protein n=1 Tax=Caldimonas sp. KR1-144 TaxID=3400911 RepID=UPI003C071102